MENDLEQPSEPVEPCEPSLVQLFGRRAFIVSVATAVSAAAFWACGAALSQRRAQ